MKIKSLFPILLFEIIIVGVLQIIPVNINTELLVTNSNFIFGLIKSNEIAIVLLLLFLVFYIYYTAKSKKIVFTLADISLVAGVTSNLLDRIFRGGATDYISISSFPTYNIADILIVIGIIVLGISYISKPEKLQP